MSSAASADETPDTGTPINGHMRRRAEDSSVWFRIPPAVVSSVFGVLVAGGAGGGIYASHSTLTSRVQEAVSPISQKMDAIVAGQQALELKIARLEGGDMDARVRDMDARLRSIEALTARLDARQGDKENRK